MTIYYDEIRVVIDPEMSDPLKGGGRLQDVSVILTDSGRRGGGGDAMRPAGVTLLACRAREVAFELLELAEQADQMMRRRP
jgi:hypothetical protein